MKKIFTILLTILIVCFTFTAVFTQSSRVRSTPPNSTERSWNPQRTWVYFVGLLEWQDKEKFASFPQKNRRDEILLNVFRQSGVPESQIIYLKDSQATISKVKDSFPKFLQQTKDGDTVIVYFCGHGYKANKNTYLATYDVSNKTEGWKVDDVTTTIEKNFKGSTAILMADNCYSGALAESAKKIGALSGISYVAMTSAHFNSFSTANWTFTESLIYAFRGDSYTDKNQDGKVTFAELETNASEDMLFAEEQIAQFAYTGGFNKQNVVALAKANNNPRIGERVESYSVDGYYKGFIRDAKDGKFQVRYYGYEESDDEWVPADKIRPAVPKQYSIGSKVNVNWLGKWFPAKVVEVKGGSHLVAYDGYTNEDDEWIPSKRIKELTQAEVKTAELQYTVGSLIEAQDYRGVWYKSKIVEAKDGKYKVHYFGWTDNWDEWVTPEKVRNSNDYEFGREVEVIQNGVWYKAQLIDSRYGTEHLVTYIGYNEEEWVKDERIRDIGASWNSTSRFGKQVEVLSKGKWYKARI